MLKGMLLITLLAWSLSPIIWNIMTSLKTRSEIFSVPPTFIFLPNLDGYGKALTPGSSSIYPTLTNSLIVSFGAMIVTLAIGSLAAYALARYKFRGKLPIFALLLATRLLPPIAAVVPLFMLMQSINLIDTYIVLILIYSALNVPFAMWLLKAFAEAVPQDLEASARVEGCNTFQAFMKITLPLMATGLAATAAFVFILSWNEFMFAFLFTTIKARTLPVRIAEVRGESIIAWQDMAAQSTLLMIPAFLLALFLQRYLVRGLTQGSMG